MIGMVAPLLCVVIWPLNLRYLAVAPLLFIVAGAGAVWHTRVLTVRTVMGVGAGVLVGTPIAVIMSGGDPVVDSVFRLVTAAMPLGAGALAGAAMLRLSTRQPTGQRPWLDALIFLIPAVYVVSLAAGVALDRNRDRDAVIRERLLGDAPLGSSMSQVRDVVSRRGWELRRASESGGFFHQGVRPAREVGAKHIEAYAGHYRDLFRVDVVVYWGFDEQGRLIDVWVWKVVDSL